MKAFIVLSALIAVAMAEADPQYLLGGYYGGYYPYAYGLPFTGCHNAAGLPVPCAQHGLAKRDAEAEPEADPQYLLGGYYGGYYPYAYGLPYAAYYHTGCTNSLGAAVPCAQHGLAKRDAESEADPAYFVSPYLAGYGFPRTYFGNGLVHTSRF